MTADREQDASDRDRPPRSSSYSQHGTPAEESPDLLRWRADLLLDEMMLGGVDVSAADGSAPAAFTPDAPSPTRPSIYPSDAESAANGDRAYANGRHDPAGYAADSYTADEAGLNGTDTAPFDPEPDEPGSRLSSHYPAAGSYRSVLDAAPSLDDEGERSSRTYGDPAQGGGSASPRSDRLYSVEQHYENFRRNQSANIQPVPVSRPVLPPTPPAPTPPAAPRERPDATTQWANTPEKWEWQDFSAAPGETPDPSRYMEPEPLAPVVESAVRQDQAQFVSAMSVMGGSKRRSTLLPRMSTLDVDALNQEIATLHGELGNLLPVGHESSERARHLLDKAYSILQSDPMRSAEVEYYMQQVRTIVQRLRQARHWSDLYRDRLRMYLMGWVLLALLVVAARFVFQLQIEAFGVVLFGGSALARHWPSLVAAMAAGALGGASGALYTMARHTRSDHGLFDRKYGLRGLMLPIIPAVLGALIYAPIGFVYALLGIDPSLSSYTDLLPMLAAFAFGFSQESLYGTRG